MDTIACVCRRIFEEDYDTEEELLTRLRQLDARCRQCLLRYEDTYENERERNEGNARAETIQNPSTKAT